MTKSIRLETYVLIIMKLNYIELQPFGIVEDERLFKNSFGDGMLKRRRSWIGKRISKERIPSYCHLSESTECFGTE